MAAPRTTSDDVFYTRTFALVALALLGVLLFWILSPFFAALAWALFIAFLITPIHLWLTTKLRGRAALSATILTLATFVILIGPLTALIAAFAAQAAALLEYMRVVSTERGGFDLASTPVLGSLLTWAQNSLGVSFDQIREWTQEGARRVLQPLAALGGKIFLGTLGTVVDFVLMMFLLFFMIRDRQKMVMIFRALLPLSSDYKIRLFAHLGSVTRAMVYGSGVTAVIQGMLVGIGFAIVGLPSPIVFGVLAAVFALVPLAGTPVVWVPAVLVLAAQQRWGAAAFLLGWGIIVATIDNFLRPMLVAGRAEVDTLTVFIGVLGGVSAFGAVGVLLGPLVLALITALIRFTLEVRAQTVSAQSKTRA
jgi:predicted PurR-regulated permease PerM